jgi:glycosyltransferase involved in cell wall biosynthesis
MIEMVAALQALGHEVRILAEDAQDLRGAVVGFAPEVLMISRPGLFRRVASRLLDLGLPIVYVAHDLHFVRVGLQRRRMGNTSPHAPTVLRMVEQFCFTTANISILPTQREADRAMEEFPGARAMRVNYYAFPERPRRAGPPARERIVFLGGAHHSPNEDAVRWFAGGIWPAMRRENSELVVCGDWPVQGELASIAGVRFVGVLPDKDLDELLSTATAGIAPLRFGAGMKRKTVHYLSHGLPVAGSLYATEGLDDDGPTPGVVHAHSLAEWRAAFDRIRDPSEWQAMSDAGRDFVRAGFSAERQQTDMAAVLDKVLLKSRESNGSRR